MSRSRPCRRPPAVPCRPRRSARGCVIAGATGVLGNEVLRRLVGLQHYGSTEVLAREPIRPACAASAAAWSRATIRAHGRRAPPTSAWCCSSRRACSTTASAPCGRRAPEQLPALAQWMRRSGVRTLAVVLPHAQGRLPEALKRGLASLDEHAVAALGFERLLIVRSAREARGRRRGRPAARRSRAGCSPCFKYMVPGSEQPVRSVKVAEFVAAALQRGAARHPRRRARDRLAGGAGRCRRGGARLAAPVNPCTIGRTCASPSSRPPTSKAMPTRSKPRSTTRCSTPTSTS